MLSQVGPPSIESSAPAASHAEAVFVERTNPTPLVDLSPHAIFGHEPIFRKEGAEAEATPETESR